MASCVAAFAVTLLVWWSSTAAILWLDRRPRGTYPLSMAGATVLLGAALCGLALTRGEATIIGAYAAFGCAIAIWAWQEIAFLLGYITGPRRAPCPEGSRGWRRAWLAFQTVLHHEVALVVLAAAVIALTAGGANWVGLATFVALYAMRQSAKLNLFLGVMNRGEALLPEHLRYLSTYFARRQCNALLPLSIAGGAAVAAFAWSRAVQAEAGGFTAAGATLVATLLTLGLVEHLLMIVPLRVDALWEWASRPRAVALPVPGPVPGATERSGEVFHA